MRIRELLDESPSLRQHLTTLYDSAWQDARKLLEVERRPLFPNAPPFPPEPLVDWRDARNGTFAVDE